MTPEQPAPPNLRPLGIGETIDDAFRLLRQHLGLYLKIAAGFLIIPTALVTAYMFSELVAIRDGFLFVRDPDAYTMTIGLLSLLGGLVQLLCFGVLVHLSTRLYLNHNETTRSILGASWHRFPPFVGLTLLLGLYLLGVIFAGALAASPFGIAGLFLILAVVVAWFTFYSLAAPAFWYEEIGAGKAIGRSSALVRGRFWKVLGALSVGLIIVAIVSFGLGSFVIANVFANSRTPYVIATGVLDLVGGMASMSMLAPIVTVVYFDARVRSEGFDMQLRLNEADAEDWPPPPSVPW